MTLFEQKPKSKDFILYVSFLRMQGFLLFLRTWSFCVSFNVTVEPYYTGHPSYRHLSVAIWAIEGFFIGIIAAIWETGSLISIIVAIFYVTGVQSCNLSHWRRIQ